MIRFLLPFLDRSGGQFRGRRRTAIVMLAISSLTMMLCGAGSRAFAQSLSGFAYNGQVYTSYQANEYLETPQGPSGTAAIRATGASYGSIVATQYVQNYTSNTIAPETASTPGYNSNSDPLSPTDSAVVAAIHNMQAQGITVFLKPHVDSLDGTYRGELAPTDVVEWFASYQTFILHYAQIASANNVGGLVIGTELASLSKAAYRSYWLNVIAQIRSSYPNLTLAYGANATYATDEFTTVSFWDKVDIMGVDGYFPLTNHADPTLAELVAAWTNNPAGLNIVSALHTVQSAYNKPMVFTELGYVSAPGTNEAPYNSASPGAAYDPTEQMNCYEAFFEVFSQQTSWMKGVFWWAWNVSPPGASDTGYTPQNKPAANVTLVKWYGSTTAGFTLAPSTSVLTLGPGLEVPVTIAATNLGGFSGNVLLTAAGLPSGVTATFAPGTGIGTQVMTLTASNSAADGSSTITITGTSGSLMATTSIALTIQGAAAQSITFANPGAQTVGTPLTLSATASSGLSVTFASTTTAVCNVSGNIASFLAAGTCTIDANQAGDASYSAAQQVQQSFTVNPAPSFTLAPSAGTISVTQGTSATDAIAVTGDNGFSGGVTLAATGLPSGVTASFSTNPATASSVLTLTASSAAAPGAATVSITGTSGSLTASTTIALTVNGPPGITLAASAPTASVAPGSSIADNISISGSGGFVGSVSLSAAVTSSPQAAQELPALSFGATDPVPVTSAGGTATLTISTTAATTADLSHPAHRSLFLEVGGGGTLACVLLFGIPARCRRWPVPLGMLAVLFALASGMVGCGGSSGSASQPTGNSGTTPGSYTITVTATGSTTTGTTATATLPVTVTVQ